MYGPVVVVYVDGSDHLGTLQVTDAQGDLKDGVSPDQLDDLRISCVTRINFQRRQFHVL